MRSRRPLDGVSSSVERGTVLRLLGPDDGKTTSRWELLPHLGWAALRMTVDPYD